MLGRVLFAIGMILLLAGLIFAALSLTPSIVEPTIIQCIARDENSAPPLPTLEQSSPLPSVGPQAIFIDTPPAGTHVGSPMTLTGRVARIPNQGLLSYVVKNSSGQQIGASTFPVSCDPGRPTSYVGILEFDLPLNGDTITAQIYDQDPANGASISLYVAPVPQLIYIASPPPGVLVGSPLTVRGLTTRSPANGQLTYRVTQNGQVLGSQSFAVRGTSGSGSLFDTQVSFSMPPEGGIIQLTISDSNTPSGPVQTMIDLDVRAQYQRLDILTPPEGTSVHSPMTIIGRTNWFPNNGQLTYRVLDASNAVIGLGMIRVTGVQGTRGEFNAQVRFTEPPNGGVIRVELSDSSSGNAIVSSIMVNVLSAPSPQIVIDNPPPGTPVGSPMTIVGHTTYVPSQLSYRVRDAANNVIGQGSVPFVPSGRQASFTASLTFNVPAASGNIVLEIFGPDPNGVYVSVTITLDVVSPQQTPNPSVVPTPNPSAVPTPNPSVVPEASPAWNLIYLSGTISVTLNPASLSTSITALPEQVTQVEPIMPGGTPGAVLQETFGSDYEAVAIAKLIAPDFKVQSIDEEQSLDQQQITWHWDVQPLGTGSQAVTVTIDVEWRPRNGGQAIRRSFGSRELSIDVRKPPLDRNQASWSSLLFTLTGSGLSLPWLVERIRLRRKRRTIQYPPDDEQRDTLIHEHKDDRVINAWVEGVAADLPLEIAGTYLLLFNIDRPRLDAAATIAFASQKIFDSLPVEVSHATILVVIETDDFMFDNDTPQTLVVPREGPSINSVAFTITPTHNGPGQITALFSVNNHVFQKMKVTLHVGAITPASTSREVQSRGITVGSALALPPRQHEHVIGIEIEPRGSGYRMKLRDAGVMSASLDLSMEKIAELVARARHDLRSIVYTQVNEGYIYQSQDTMIPSAIHETALKTLAELGYYLYQSLFYAPGNGSEAHELGARLRWLSQHQQLIIEIDAERFVFPWALIYDRDPLDLNHIDPEGFWGFKHSIEYLPQFRVAPTDFVHTIDVEDNLQLGFIFNTLIDDQLDRRGLAPVVEPQRSLLRRLSGVHVTYHPMCQDLYQLLNQVDSPVQFLYFYCHAEGRIPGDWRDVANILKKDIPRVIAGQEMQLADGAVQFDVDSSSMQLSDGSVRLSDLKIKAPTHRPRLHQAPLVFLNACQSAELSPYFYDGLVPYLIAKGARGVIGTEVDTPVYFAAEFAQAFLDRFTQGEQPLGKLLLDLRREYVLKRNNILGLAYGLYSSGDIVVLRRSAEKRE